MPSDVNSHALRGTATSNLISRDFSAMQVLYHGTVAGMFNVSLTDYKCLDLVLRADPALTAGTLAALSGLSPAAITGVLDRLERAGYVKRVRDCTDRRRILIVPVEGIVERFSWIFEPLVHSIDAMEQEFTDAEIQTIRRYMSRATEMFHQQIIVLRSHLEATRLGPTDRPKSG